jgi:hypothetical protein
MKREQKQQYILQLMTYRDELQRIALERFNALEDHDQLNRDSVQFEDELYDEIWAAILEEKLNIYDSKLETYADEAIPNRNSPFGYRIVTQGDKVTLAVCPIEAEVVHLIYHWYLNSNYSLRDIAEKLQEIRIPTPGDIHLRRKPKTKWGDWHMSTVHSITTSETYIGNWTYYDAYRGKRISKQVPAIIALEEYLSAKNRLLISRNKPYHATKYSYLLANRVKCGQCQAQAKLIGRSSEEIVLYYRCPTKGCRTRGFGVEETDARVWRSLKTVFTENLSYLQLMGNKYHEANRAKKEDVQNQLKIVSGFLEEYVKRYQLLQQLDLPSDFIPHTRHFYNAYLSEAIGQLDRARKEIEQALVTTDDLPELNIDRADEDFALRQAIIELLDLQVSIEGRNKSKTITVNSMLGSWTLSIQ